MNSLASWVASDDVTGLTYLIGSTAFSKDASPVGVRYCVPPNVDPRAGTSMKLSLLLVQSGSSPAYGFMASLSEERGWMGPCSYEADSCLQ